MFFYLHLGRMCVRQNLMNSENKFYHQRWYQVDAVNTNFCWRERRNSSTESLVVGGTHDSVHQKLRKLSGNLSEHSHSSGATKVKKTSRLYQLVFAELGSLFTIGMHGRPDVSDLFLTIRYPARL